VKGVYFDEGKPSPSKYNQKCICRIVIDLSGRKNRKKDAGKYWIKVDEMMLQENFPYGMASRGNMHNKEFIIILRSMFDGR
jgi:hypothetical protein